MARKSKTTENLPGKALFAGLAKIDRSKMAKTLGEAIDDNTSGGGGGTGFISFSGKTNVWAMGRDKVDIDGCLAIYDIENVYEGWACWKGNKVVQKIRWPLFERDLHIVEEDELPDHGPYPQDKDGWKTLRAAGFVVQLDSGWEPGLYETTTISAINALGDLEREVKARLEDEKETKLVPVFYVGSEGFDHDGNHNYKPTFEVEAWLSPEEAQRLVDGASLEDLMKAPEKVQKGGRSAKSKARAPKAPAEEEAPQTRSRRRRVAA